MFKNCTYYLLVTCWCKSWSYVHQYLHNFHAKFNKILEICKKFSINLVNDKGTLWFDGGNPQEDSWENGRFKGLFLCRFQTHRGLLTFSWQKMQDGAERRFLHCSRVFLQESSTKLVWWPYYNMKISSTTNL